MIIAICFRVSKCIQHVSLGFFFFRSAYPNVSSYRIVSINKIRMHGSYSMVDQSTLYSVHGRKTTLYESWRKMYWYGPAVLFGVAEVSPGVRGETDEHALFKSDFLATKKLPVRPMEIRPWVLMSIQRCIWWGIRGWWRASCVLSSWCIGRYSSPRWGLPSQENCTFMIYRRSYVFFFVICFYN